MPKFSFVILTYNSEAYIEKLLNSIFKFYERKIEEKEIEIIVVDNNSSDRTVSEIKKFENIKLIEHGKNFGFSKGINIGVSGSSSDFSVIINPDTELFDGSIFEILEQFKKNDKVAVVGGKIMSKKKIAEKSCGKFLKTFEVFLMSLGLDELLGVRFSPDKIKEVDFVSGGFMIVRKKIFKKLSGFDEKLFMYTEDMELCYRLKREGFKVLFSPEISIIHEGQGSSSRSFAVENIYKGIFYFHKKHGNFISQLMTSLILKSKALVLVLIGRIINNKYLTATYLQALKT